MIVEKSRKLGEVELAQLIYWRLPCCIPNMAHSS